MATDLPKHNPCPTFSTIGAGCAIDRAPYDPEVDKPTDFLLDVIGGVVRARSVDPDEGEGITGDPILTPATPSGRAYFPFGPYH